MDIELCRNFFALRRNYTVFAGFSGGADSTAALLTALHFQKEYALNIVAVHFNHHLRGAESDGDAFWCRLFAEKHGIEYREINLHFSDTTAIEDAARQARLQHWMNLAANKEKCAVMLGHHADDRMENFFLRLLRGSNLSGLLAPKAEYNLNGVDIFRPLLCFSRKEIEAFLLQQNIDNWRIDSTNAQNDCSRNVLRNTILPQLFKLFPGAAGGVNQSLKVLAQDADFIESCAAEKFDESLVSSRSYWQNLHPALIVRILRLWRGNIPTADFVSRFQEELKLPPPEEVRKIPFGKEFICFQKEHVFPEPAETVLPEEIVWNLKFSECVWGDWHFFVESTSDFRVCSKFEAVFDAEKLGEILLIAPPCPGERMTIFGTNRTEKLKKLRIDSKIPAHYHLPVVKNAEGIIVWAPGIKHSALATADKNSRKLLKISVKSAKFGIGFGIN